MAANPNNPTSQKVSSGVVSSTITTLILWFITSNSPDLLSLFGKYQVLVVGAVAIAAFAIAAWRKEDPLRAAGIAAQEAENVVQQVQSGAAPAAHAAPVEVAQAVAAVEPFIPAALQKLAQAPATPAAPQIPSV